MMFVSFVLCIITIFVIHQMFLRGHKRSYSFSPSAITVVLILGLCVGFGPRISGASVDGSVRTVFSEALPASSNSELTKRSNSHRNGIDKTNVEKRHNSVGPCVEMTDHGNMFVGPRSSSVQEVCPGPHETIAEWSLCSAPVTGSACVLVSNPKLMGNVVPGLHALTETIVHLALAAATAPDSVRTPDVSKDAKALVAKISTVERPDWIEQPDEGQFVVKSEFEETQELVRSRLATKIVQVLFAEARETLGLASEDPASQDPGFVISEHAVELSIIDRFQEEVILETANGTKRMVRTTVLVQFPAELKTQAVRHVKESLRNRRTWTVAGTGVSLGLVVILAAGLFQLVESSSRTIRRIGVPLVTLLMLAGATFSCQLVCQIVVNESAEIPSSLELPHTTIGMQSRSDSPSTTVR